ncbi:MarR family transcriptional regulator [Deinococcus aerophilus]|uniref:MarR family transcriptional regulator n=2 Tax=Deinococcus aerophilus TaxID=522488 RepID=A0ABQ2GM82_9DEIO|nr:MarR family transcriptional regulator [Deinococcus aerophilus]
MGMAQAPTPDLHSPEVQFLTALWDTWQALVAAGAAQLEARHALDLRGFIALSYLQTGPQQPAELARHLGIARYEVSRTLAALDGLGAVTRERGGTDARGVTVRITPAGRDRWAAALQTVRAVTGPSLAGLSPASASQLTQSLQTVAHAARQERSP